MILRDLKKKGVATERVTKNLRSINVPMALEKYEVMANRNSMHAESFLEGT